MPRNEVVVMDGPAFVVSHDTGDIRSGTTQGFYHNDTRYLSGYELLVNRRLTNSLSSGSVAPAAASFFSLRPGGRQFAGENITVVRDRYVKGGFHDDVALMNHSLNHMKLHLTFRFAADFADVFEVRLARISKKGHIHCRQLSERELCFSYERGNYIRQTSVSFSEMPEIRGATASFDLELPPKGSWRTCLSVAPAEDGQQAPSLPCRTPFFGEPLIRSRAAVSGPARIATAAPPVQDDLQEWLANVPSMTTDWLDLRLAYDQAVQDLASLRFPQDDHNVILAAGLPWFMAIFGRDAIISALQTMMLDAQIAAGTLRVLASYQANSLDAFREAQPGKIPHEVRRGELARLEEIPHSRYYGTVDATPLFLILLHEAYAWSGDLEMLRALWPAAEAALAWIDRYGDIDGDGFVEYRGAKSQFRLRNQGWKDSHDSIRFADGSLARGPIALAEVQGYVYDAKRRMAGLYEILGGNDRALQLRREAEELRRRFNESFWMPKQQFYALALDGEKRQVDSITSNPGHCLWSGIIAEDKARAVAQRLLSDDMFSGWGIRTMSSYMAAYDPISYHNGSVWPHDNSLIAEGLRRYGFSGEAFQVISGLIDASNHFPHHRLPELFAGYPRREHSFPVEYPAANSPQAWASGAIIYLLHTLLGLTLVDGRLLEEPLSDAPPVRVTGISYRGQRRTL